MLTPLANRLWLWNCRPAAQAFTRAARNVATAQHALLMAIVQGNANSSFGYAHNFAALRTVADFQAAVPLSDYDSVRPYVERIAAGAPQVLTVEPVRLLEPTSGSSAAPKLIPYTAGLSAAFQRAIGVWMADLLSTNPQVLGGRAYWQISPALQQQTRSAGGIPIGFDEDAAYLGGFQRALAQLVLAMPADVRQIDAIESFRYCTLRFLLGCADLRLISVWNPTFLSLLLDRLTEWGARLADDLAEGTIRPPAPLAPALATRLNRGLRPDRRRADVVRAALRAAPDQAGLSELLWPQLRLLSCWADANAARYAADLARRMPHAVLQPKGLIATEGFVSIPLVGQPGAALAVTSHFFEFLPTDGGSPRLAHELERDTEYEVVLTTSGGLYRYRLYDCVVVTGHVHGCPLLRFRGKTRHIADWFGEKLDERHVAAALDAALSSAGVQQAPFALVACSTTQTPPAYTLFIESAAPNPLLQQLGKHIEAHLCANVHYRYCRDLGQLGPLQVFRIAAGGMRSYQETLVQRGQRAGDGKPLALDRGSGWEQVFYGALVGK